MTNKSHDVNPEIWSKSSRRIDGSIEIGGCDLRSLASEFGTPLFVMDEDDLHHRMTTWKGEHARAFHENAGNIYYAAKAFISVEVAKMIAHAGLAIDVCTGGELAVAQAAQFPGHLIEMHGNNKSESEIKDAIDYGVRTIVIDSLQEIERVSRIARSMGVNQKVMIRLTPGVEAHTHESIKTAHEDVKFGFSIASGAAWQALENVLSHADALTLVGVHAHIGSQIFATDGFETTAERLIGFLARYRDVYSRELEELCIGGGYGIAYIDGDAPLSPNQFLSSLARVIKNESEKYTLRHPRVSIEPGRAIIGPTMTTIYQVGTTKEVTLDEIGRAHV